MIKRSKEWWAAQAQREGDSEVGAGFTTAMEGLEEDSEDFTQEEAEAALPCQNVERLIAHIRAQTCPMCQEQVVPILHEMRRRDKVLYWRMTLTCADEHVKLKTVVRTDWIRGSL